MKKLIYLLTIVMLSVTASFAKGPSLDAVRAAKIATDHLASRGLSSSSYIQSVTLEPGALLSGSSSWVVRWSQSFQADGEKEIGLRVRMDGSITRLVEGKGSKSGRWEPAAQGIR